MPIKSTRIPVSCAVCDTIRMYKPSVIADGKGKYCSKACRVIGIRTHGETNSSEFRTWSSIKTRCFNPSSANYPRYGGRGITICDAWRDSFEAFLADMGRRPSTDHSIDRIDNDGNYEPGNVRWATTGEQAHNRSTNRLVTFNGVTQTVGMWARVKGMGKTVLLWRLDSGWSVERALTAPVRGH